MISSIDEPRAWHADTVDDPRSWRVELSPSSLSALDEFEHERGTRPAIAVRASQALIDACAVDIETVRWALESRRGFVIIGTGPPDCYSAERLSTFYWLVGDMLGRPIEQNVQGALLYDVRDTGQDVRYGARFSVTKAESTFHTDNSFGAEVLDYVGLLCLNAAKAGGASQIVSGIAVQDKLRREHPETLNLLREPFHFDRRGGLRQGDEPTVRFPVLTGDGSDLVIRYLRYWIETGHEKAGVPLTAEQIGALDLFDRIAGELRMRVEFDLKPGEILWVNNRWILHNRTAYEDHPEPERRRHLLRLWVRRAQ